MPTQSTPTKSEQIREYLLTKYPCQAVPLGALTDVAVLFGVSRELVRQQAEKMGFGKIRKTPPACPDCGGKKAYNSARCAACFSASRRITLTCDVCGVQFERRISVQIKATDIGTYGRTTQQIICSPSCRFKAQGEKVRAARAVKKWDAYHNQLLPTCPDCGGPKAKLSIRCRACYNSYRAAKNAAA